MSNFQFIIDGETITVEISKHARQRAEERYIGEYDIYGMIVKIGEDIFDLKPGEQFAVLDQDEQNGVICQVITENGNIIIEVVTVLSNDVDRVYVTRGTKTFRINIFEKL